MSTQRTEQSNQPPANRGPMAGMMGGPPAKSKDFKGSLKRLLKELEHERKTLVLIFGLITTSVIIGSFGPRILGRATNYIFYGYLGHRLPSGISKVQAVDNISARRPSPLARRLATAWDLEIPAGNLWPK